MRPTSKRMLAAVGAPLLGLFVFIACGPGDLSRLTRGEPLSETPDDDSGLPPIPTCKGAVAPERPASEDGEGLPELIFAMDNMRVDSNKEDAGTALPPPTSFNLDNNCSCDVDYSCIPPDGGITARLCDDKEGRDNVTGSLLSDLGKIVPTASPAFLKGRIEAGVFSMLISVVNWNGQPNDSRVIVGIRMSTGIDNGIDTKINDRFKPRFDGQDTWSVDPVSIASGPDPDSGIPCGPTTCVPRALDFEHGYITNNKLVAYFPEVNIAFVTPSGRLELPYRGVTLVADIRMDDKGVRHLDGQLAGRWPTDAILNASAAFSSPETPETDLCTSPFAYQLFKDSICKSADLAADLNNDNKRGTRCGALSEAMRFTAITAKLGTTRVPEASGTGNCHAKDTCP